MGKIKVLEKFYSVQGEARYTGVPSVFLRVFGCNFTCSGFGMPKGELSTERNEIDAKKYTTLDEVPLATTGCDSFTSWDMRFKHLAKMQDVNEIANEIVDLLPFKQWKDEHLVITGGEPLLGWQRAYPELLNHEKMYGLKEITFETNGTQPLTKEFAEFLEDWMWQGPSQNVERELTFSVSPKLSCSGEPREKAIRPEIVAGYQRCGYTYLKYVVSTEEDVEEALEVTKLYREAGFNGPVYLMPVGGTVETYQLNNKRVAELAMQHGLRYSDRLHISLFGNQWGT